MKKSYATRGGGGRGGNEVGRRKNPRQGESLDKDKDKDKTDSTIANKQDPQDTPAGRRIRCSPWQGFWRMAMVRAGK